MYRGKATLNRTIEDDKNSMHCESPSNDIREAKNTSTENGMDSGDQGSILEI